jgi:Leucine-rich repeat (LRR) protein
MAQMRNLMIEGTPVADLTPLSGMGHLRDLWLNGTAVTDLTPLARCRALRRLSLRNTAVNDLMPLAGLPDLEFLDITGTQVRDLTPVLRLPRFGVGEGEAGIAFADTPAVARDPVLARLCDAQEDPFRLAEDLMDFLTGGAQMQGWRGDA